MRLLTVSFRNLTRRPLRTGLTVAGVTLAVAALIALVSLARGLEQSFLDLYNERGADLVVQHSGESLQLASGVDEQWADRIAALPHVRQVIAGLMDVVALPQFDLFAVLVNGWEPTSPVLRQITLLRGRQLAAEDHQAVMLGRVLAANTGKDVGDNIELYGESFQVIGVFESSSVYENGAAFFLRSVLQRLMGRVGQVTGFLVLSDQPGNPPAIAELRTRIEALSPTLKAQPTAEFVHSITQIRVTRAAAWVTAAIATALAALSVLNTLMLSVIERTSEIGALRAMGWPRRQVVRLIGGESLLLALAAIVPGCLLGLGLLKLFAHWPATAGLISGHTDLSVLVLAALVAAATGLLGAVYPAWWAARLWPIDAMRRK